MSVDTIKITCDDTDRYGGEIALVGPDDSGDIRLMITAEQNGNRAQITGLYADLPSLNVLHAAIGRRLLEAGVTMRDTSVPAPTIGELDRYTRAYVAARSLEPQTSLPETLALARFLAGDAAPSQR